MATDTRAMTQAVPINAGLNQHSTDASNMLIGGFIATPVALYGLGTFQAGSACTEAGILTGEAMLDSVVVEQGMKLIFWRERPNQDSARGHFFESDAGIDSSFPSSHSVVAWSAAAVLAGEYPSRWSQLFIYSAAAGVSVTRILGQQHFPSDVLVGCCCRMARWPLRFSRIGTGSSRSGETRSIEEHRGAGLSARSHRISYTGKGFLPEKNLRWCQ